MRLRRASVIAALILLTSAATSYAECAWVLWFNPEANIHVVESAHASVMECARGLAGRPHTRRLQGIRRFILQRPRPARRKGRGTRHISLSPRHRGPAWAEGEVRTMKA
jgi:hypothetical protein